MKPTWLQHGPVDVLILGRGLVGLASALVAARAGYRVLICDRQPRAVPALPSGAEPASFATRVYALSPGNQAWLQSLGVWPLVRSDRCQTVQAMQLWGQGGSGTDGALRLEAYTAGATQLTTMLESDNLEFALQQALQPWVEQGQVSYGQAQPVRWEADARFATVHFASTAGGAAMGIDVAVETFAVSARLVLGCDGAQSWLRQQLAVPVQSKTYAHTALVANFACERPQSTEAWQWFQGDSIMAWLPLPNGVMSLVWSLPPERAQAYWAEPERLAERVAAAGAQRWGRLTLLNQPATFPLREQVAQQMQGPRWLLLGDAAHVVHPLAGQGVNLGLRDVRTLAQLWERAPVDPGESWFLQQWAMQRSADVLRIRALTQSMYHLFRPVAWQPWRRWGMRLLNASPLLKRQLIAEAQK